MNYVIEHMLEYRYSEEVWLEPLVVRLCPLSTCDQRVGQYELEVIPEPAGSSLFVDAAGNNAQRLWFDGHHRKLRVVARTRASVSRSNPFDFLLEPEATTVPFSYSVTASEVLQPYLATLSVPAVCGLARRALDETMGQTVSFLVRLCETIHREFRVRRRPRGDPRHPGITLLRKEGACRDVAALFGEACRSVGIATRFVSGYAYRPDLRVPELHAWSEVYLPGAGWRGFDPSTGLVVDSSYLALAAGPSHDQTRPASGAFRGTARSRLKTRIRLEAS